MKKILSVMLCAGLLLATLAGCGGANTSEAPGGGSNEPPESDDKINVVTTIFAPYDFARQIAGDQAELTMLLPPASESHSYEPTPKDIIKIQNCDVFVYIGGESDAWVQTMLSSFDTSNMQIITLMDCVEVLEEEITEGMQDDHAHDEAEAGHDDDHVEEETEYDRHVWTSPKNAKKIVQKLSDALCEADLANADAYRQNTAAYLTQLDELDASFQATVDAANRKTIVFGDQFPFRYLADAYGLDYFAAFPGCSSDTEASAATVVFLINKVKSEQIPVVFHVELSNKKMANTISEATGAKVLLLHACHNVSKAEFESGAGYLDLMRQNVKNLQEALN